MNGYFTGNIVSVKHLVKAKPDWSIITAFSVITLSEIK